MSTPTPDDGQRPAASDGTAGEPAPAYGTPPAPPVPPVYGAAPVYGTPPAYGAAPAYSSEPGTYAAAPTYGSSSAYGAAPAYNYGQTKTNTLAIVSLVSSLVGFFLLPFIGSLAGVITGHMSLGQIKRTGEGGRGLGLAGTIIGWVGLGFAILGLILLLVLLPLLLAGISQYSYYSG